MHLPYTHGCRHLPARWSAAELDVPPCPSWAGGQSLHDQPDGPSFRESRTICNRPSGRLGSVRALTVCVGVAAHQWAVWAGLLSSPSGRLDGVCGRCGRERAQGRDLQTVAQTAVWNTCRVLAPAQQFAGHAMGTETAQYASRSASSHNIVCFGSRTVGCMSYCQRWKTKRPGRTTRDITRHFLKK